MKIDFERNVFYCAGNAAAAGLGKLWDMLIRRRRGNASIGGFSEG